MRAEDGRRGRGRSLPGELTMTFHEYLSKAVQDDVQLAAERDRLLLVARRAHRARRRRAGLAAPVRQRLTRLLFRRAPA
jgi:hypothetical protein